MDYPLAWELNKKWAPEGFKNYLIVSGVHLISQSQTARVYPPFTEIRKFSNLKILEIFSSK